MKKVKNGMMPSPLRHSLDSFSNSVSPIRTVPYQIMSLAQTQAVPKAGKRAFCQLQTVANEAKGLQDSEKEISFALQSQLASGDWHQDLDLYNVQESSRKRQRVSVTRNNQSFVETGLVPSSGANPTSSVAAEPKAPSANFVTPFNIGNPSPMRTNLQMTGNQDSGRSIRNAPPEIQI